MASATQRPLLPKDFDTKNVGVDIPIEGADHAIHVKPNPILHALYRLNFGDKMLNMNKLTELHNARPIIPQLELDKKSDITAVEYYNRLLKLALPIQLGRTGGVLRVDGKVHDNRNLKDLLKNDDAIASFKQMMSNYVVPVYFLPYQLIVADRTAPDLIPKSLLCGPTTRKSITDPLDKNAIKLFLINLILNRNGERTKWLETTILQVTKAQKYLEYLDEKLIKLKMEFSHTLEDLEKKLAKAKKAFEKSLATYKETTDATFRAKAKEEAKKDREKVASLTEAIEQEKKRLNPNYGVEEGTGTEDAHILSHGICVADYAVVLDKETLAARANRGRKKKAATPTAEGADEENDDEDEDENNDADDDENNDAGSSSISKKKGNGGERVEEGSLKLEEVELLKIKFIWQLQAHLGNKANDIFNGKGKSKSVKYNEQDIQLFAPYRALRSCALYTDGTLNRTETKFAFPDNSTNSFRAQISRTKDENVHGTIFSLNEVTYPVFSIRTLLANYAWIVSEYLKIKEVEAKKSSKKSAKAETDDEPVPEKKPKKPVVAASKKTKRDDISLSASSEEGGDDASKKKQGTTKPPPSKKQKKVEESSDLMSLDDKPAAIAAPKKKVPAKVIDPAPNVPKEKPPGMKSAAAEDSAEDSEERELKARLAAKKKAKEEAAKAEQKKHLKNIPQVSLPEPKKTNTKASDPLELSQSKELSSDSEVSDKKATKAAPTVTKRKREELNASKEDSMEKDHVKETAKKSKKDESAAPPAKKKAIAADTDGLSASNDEEDEATSPAPAAKNVPEKFKAAADVKPVLATKKKGSDKEAVPVPIKKVTFDVSDSDDEEDAKPTNKAKKRTTPETISTATKAGTTPKPIFDATNPTSLVLEFFASDGEWDTTLLVSGESKESIQMVDEISKTMVASVVSNNFHDKVLPTSMTPANTELLRAHESLTTMGNCATDTLIKALVMSNNVESAPFRLANTVLSENAVVESDYESAAQDYITSIKGAADMSDIINVVVNSCDLVLRTFEMSKPDFSHGVNLLIDAVA